LISIGFTADGGHQEHREIRRYLDLDRMPVRVLDMWARFYGLEVAGVAVKKEDKVIMILEHLGGSKATQDRV
jgi:hypothetical protein